MTCWIETLWPRSWYRSNKTSPISFCLTPFHALLHIPMQKYNCHGFYYSPSREKKQFSERHNQVKMFALSINVALFIKRREKQNQIIFIFNFQRRISMLATFGIPFLISTLKYILPKMKICM